MQAGSVVSRSGYDEFGVATSLATGSGFWAVEGGLTMLYPSDPAVIFGSLSYLHNVSRDIDNDTPPEPGDAPPTLRERTLSAQADEIRAALDACGGDRERVCEQLGISKTTLWRRLRAAKR